MANQALVKKALEQATPVQLIRVRALVGKNYGAYGYDSWAWRYKQALEAFDNGKYGDEQIAFLLKDAGLAEALR